MGPMPAASLPTDEPWVVLSIGSVLGGGGSGRRISDQLAQLSECVVDARSHQPDFNREQSAGINVVYFVSGNTHQPDFSGIRTGSWFGKRRIQVDSQVSVPSELAHPQEVAHFLADTLQQAVELAAARILKFKRSAHLSTREATEVAARAAAHLRNLAK